MSEQRSSAEYHRADPAYRRQMQAWLVVTAVGGALAIVALQLWLRRLGIAAAAQGDPSGYERWLQWLLAGICLVFAVAAAGFAQWLFRMALATRAERRWPPVSMRTSADVRIRYLTSADSLVSQLRLGAFALALLALFLGAWAIWLFWSR